MPIGTSYTEQGYKATLNGEDYTSNVKTTGTVDSNQAGLYYITYSATNSDGFTVTATRTVAVCDPAITTDISGTYTTQDGSFSAPNATAYDFTAPDGGKVKGMKGKILYGQGKNIHGMPCDSICVEVAFDDDDNNFTYRYTGVRHSGFYE